MTKFINSFYKLGEGFLSQTSIEAFQKPKLINLNRCLLKELNLNYSIGRAERVFSGNEKLKGSKIYSTVYSGHQFGSYVKQLGDGRAHFLGEIDSGNGKNYEIQLKGSGKTPYSRFGDGKAVLRSSVREYIASEALYNLGIPTTRALCLVGSDEDVERGATEKAAMVTRVAESFIRFGHFEYFTHTQQPQKTKRLADFIVDKYFKNISQEYKSGDSKRYEKLFYEIVKSTAYLISKWQSFGFVHGVMNSDNMSVLGLTIDYGPYGFIDEFDFGFVPNKSDHSGRYSYMAQPSIGLWNLQALAYGLEPVIKLDEAQEILSLYSNFFHRNYNQLMSKKLGLKKHDEKSKKLTTNLLKILHDQKIDYTIFFRKFCDYNLDAKGFELISLFGKKSEIKEWLESYNKVYIEKNWADLNKDKDKNLTARSFEMKKFNPKFIARNYLLQNAISLAERGDYSEVEKLFNILQNPYDEQPEFDNYASLPPDWANEIYISCSS